MHRTWRTTISLLIALGTTNALISLSAPHMVKRDANGTNSENKPIVFLTVSSMVQTDEQGDRRLELNWENVPHEDYNNSDVSIYLYDRDPSQSSASPLVEARPTTKGYFRSSIRFPLQTFTKDNLSNRCLGYWIAYVRKDKIEAQNCIRAEPRWMGDSKAWIENLTLIDLMIPGTHNTGSYTHFSSRGNGMFNKYLFTQEERIWNQLVYGIRYLDLRVAYYRTQKSPEVFWITHSTFRTDVAVKDVFRTVREFLDATDEIVIMDFHRFVTGFQNRRNAMDRHRELVTMLEQELGDYLIPFHFTSKATLNQLWSTNKRLYVGYAERIIRNRNVFLFPAIRQLWGNVDLVPELRTFLNATVCNPVHSLSSAMAQLTPKTSGVIFNTYGGLRKMADEVNRLITKWFRHEWNECANIIATDFFLGNNMIELSIETNLKRGKEIYDRLWGNRYHISS